MKLLLEILVGGGIVGAVICAFIHALAAESALAWVVFGLVAIWSAGLAIIFFGFLLGLFTSLIP